MYIEIIRGTELKREVWQFSISHNYASSSGMTIYYDSYFQQHKDTTRQRIWRVDGHYDRLNHRDNNITQPPLPKDVENEVRQKICEIVQKISITW